jgi:hypothetical protein
VRHPGGNEEHVAFVHEVRRERAVRLADVDADRAAQLLEQLVARVAVEVVPTVRATDHHGDELGVGEHDLVRHGWAERLGVLLDPGGKVYGAGCRAHAAIVPVIGRQIARTEAVRALWSARCCWR